MRLASTQAGDVLAATTTGTPITQSYNAANGTLQLSGSATPAQYQQMIDSITFSSTSNNPTALGLSTSRTIEFLVNDGAVQAGPLLGPKPDFTAGKTPVSVAVADVNGDGKLDLAVANANSTNVSVLLGDGNGGFQTASNFTTGASPQSVAFGDFNGSGGLD